MKILLFEFFVWGKGRDRGRDRGRVKFNFKVTVKTVGGGPTASHFFLQPKK